MAVTSPSSVSYAFVKAAQGQAILSMQDDPMTLAVHPSDADSN
jgi:hypothetical protein